MKVSVIIPTYNRDMALLNCLLALRCQVDPPEFEIIIVAREPSKDLIDHIHALKKVKPEIRILATYEPGNGPAKNCAAVQAEGKFLVFTDDDCIPDKHWLNKLITLQFKSGADIVSGQCLPFDLNNMALVAHQGHIMYHLDKNPGWTEYSGSACCAFIGTTMNLLVRKRTFLDLLGFNNKFATHYGDDFDFNQKWANKDGIVAVYSPYAIVRHNHVLTLKKLIKLSFRYGMGLYHCALSENGENRLLRKDYKWVYMPRKEYLSMFDYISEGSTELDSSSKWLRYRAAFVEVLMQEVKRLGGWYAKRHPDKPSKIYT